MKEQGTGRILGLTNAHVVTRPNERRVGDPVAGIINGVKKTIGHVIHHAPYNNGSGNTVDLAVIKLNDLARRLARPFAIQTFSGKVVGSGTLSFSRFGGAHRPHAYGGSTQTRQNQAVAVSGPVEYPLVDFIDASGARIRFARVFSLVAESPGVKRGHSGSLIVRKLISGNLTAVGLLAAGSGSMAFAFSMSDVHRELRRAKINVV